MQQRPAKLPCHTPQSFAPDLKGGLSVPQAVVPKSRRARCRVLGNHWLLAWCGVVRYLCIYVSRDISYIYIYALLTGLGWHCLSIHTYIRKQYIHTMLGRRLSNARGMAQSCQRIVRPGSVGGYILPKGSYNDIDVLYNISVCNSVVLHFDGRCWLWLWL